jgi:hypothetical protein
MVRGRFSALLVAIVFAIAFAAAPAHAQMKLVKPAGGFPVKITKSGSYILDANLLVGVILPDAIKVSVSNVSINLNGFAIIGPAAGSGMGVDAVGQNNVTVTNGTITGMGGAGVSTGNNGTVQNVRIIANGVGAAGGDGVACGTGCLISGSVIAGNASGDAISVTDATSGYLNNIITGNLATVVGGTNMGGNVCNGTATCP